MLGVWDSRHWLAPRSTLCADPPNEVDRAIAYPWSYVNGKKYKDNSGYHTRSIVDVVSRGGIFLLSLTPKGDGSIPPEEQKIMRGIGRRMKVNGEAIYGTRPWKIHAEGPIVTRGLKRNAKGEEKVAIMASFRTMRFSASFVVDYRSLSVACLTQNWSLPEKTRLTVRPSTLIHLDGKSPCSPGPVSHLFVKNAVVHGPHGSEAS